MQKRTDEGAIRTAVRAYCLQCSGGSRRELEKCSREDCPLHPYRNGNSRSTDRSGMQICAGQIHIDAYLGR